MKRGPVTGRRADRCFDCRHMRRFHHYVNDLLDLCYRCNGRHLTQNRAKSAHRFVEEPNDE